jgi:DTW domain-containing protein YfiP
MMELEPAFRPRCLRCRRPQSLCLCRDLVPCATRTRVVILQHPREHTMKMGTARLAHLGLASSELHVGVRFDDHPHLAALAREPHGVVLLYPGSGATPVDRVVDPPRTLVVVDGTWITARKIVSRNRWLRGLPRLSVRPDAPSAYRIRREPAPECLATLEAIVAALVALEGDAARFAPLQAAFAELVRTQLRYARGHSLPYRHDRKQRRPRRPSTVEHLLATRFADVVVAQAEGNPHDAGGPHELVQLVALRPATGARFALTIRPRRPLGARTPARLGLCRTLFDDGVSIDEARHAWAAFLRPEDVLVGWGTFTSMVLAAEGLACPTWIDLRSEVARRLGRRAGGADAACRALEAPVPAPWAPGRAGQRLAALAALVSHLRPVR